MKLFGKTSGNVLYPLCVDSSGHLQIDPLYLAEDDNNNKIIPLADGGRELIVRPDHDEKIIGLEDQYLINVILEDALVGGNSLNSPVVPDGQIVVLTVIAIWNTTSANTRSFIHAYLNSLLFTLIVNPTPVKGIPELFTGELYMFPGDYITAQFNGCVADDNLYLRACGYTFKMP